VSLLRAVVVLVEISDFCFLRHFLVNGCAYERMGDVGFYHETKQIWIWGVTLLHVCSLCGLDVGG